jgi:hypothetical protein
MISADGITWFIWGVVVSTLIGAVIGQFKGRVGAGAFGGFLLGPIGWLIVGLASDNRRQCPECKGAVPDDARRCRHCSAPLITVTEPTRRKPVVEMTSGYAEDGRLVVIKRERPAVTSMRLRRRA